MIHLDLNAIPYGVYYCRTCGDHRPCEVAPGHNALDPECPVECTTCHERIGEEVDVRERWPLPADVQARQTLTPEERAKGRARARRMALGTWDREYPLTVEAPAAAPPPGYRERAAADIERMRGRR